MPPVLAPVLVLADVLVDVLVDDPGSRRAHLQMSSFYSSEQGHVPSFESDSDPSNNPDSPPAEYPTLVVAKTEAPQTPVSVEEVSIADKVVGYWG